MLIINKLKPIYINKKDKQIRMGNFKYNGKEIDYDDENILSIFKNISNPISKEELITKVHKETNIEKSEINDAIDYLISESFIIDEDKYNLVANEKTYNRQNLFFNMFSDKMVIYNEKLKNKNILILGLGGIGSNSTIILSRAGFNNFTLVDCDKVEKSNLIRQLPYNEKDIGKLKTTCLYKKIKTKDNIVNVKNIRIMSNEDIENEVKKADFVLCTLDKPARRIRRIINSICVKYNKPVLFCGFSEYVGMIGPMIVPHKTACLSCIEKDLPDEPLNNVTLVPSFGPLCLLISSIASNEIINYYTNYNKNNLIGKTLMFNLGTYECEIKKWKKKKNCKECDSYDSK